MKNHFPRRTALYAATLLALGTIAEAQAGAIDFSPLNTSGILNAVNVSEDAPFLLNSSYTQSVIVDQLNVFTSGYQPGTVGGGARWGNWDMLTLNETGPDAGRYMFIPHEISGQGVSRYDFQTNTMVNIAENNTVTNNRLDPARWTPWGTVIAGDEGTGGSIFEILNPLAGDVSTITTVRRLDIGRVAFEGISRAADGNWYYGDENGTGGIFKYVPKAANVGTPDELVGGQIFVMKLENATANAVSGNANGSGTWIALNDVDGNPLFTTDPRVDSRKAAAEAGATGFNRPEDSVIRELSNGNLQYLITITGTNSVIAVEIDAATGLPTVVDYANRATIDLATGVAVGAGTGGKDNGFESPDNIALGPDGNIYVVEDGEPLGGDIWTLVDLNNDGDVFDLNEGFARFASLLTAGSEPTGLYWDEFRGQWLVNVQHPSSGNGMTVGIKPVPVPAAAWLFGSAIASVAGFRRRNRKA